MSTETNPKRQKKVEKPEAELENDVKKRPTQAGSGTRARQDASVNTEEHPRYVISIAAQILGVHPQTLRLYEREGLVEPQRSGGKIRLYSERDIDRVRSIMRLTSDLGVNLAGADAILYMRERMLRLYEEMDRMRYSLLAELEELRRELDVD
jgi:MerR family transcriptional regulator/heat shock protein HspR